AVYLKAACRALASAIVAGSAWAGADQPRIGQRRGAVLSRRLVLLIADHVEKGFLGRVTDQQQFVPLFISRRDQRRMRLRGKLYAATGCLHPSQGDTAVARIG